MLLLLQEALAYIEDHQKWLSSLNLVTNTSKKKYQSIRHKLARQILITLHEEAFSNYVEDMYTESVIQMSNDGDIEMGESSSGKQGISKIEVHIKKEPPDTTNTPITNFSSITKSSEKNQPSRRKNSSKEDFVNKANDKASEKENPSMAKVVKDKRKYKKVELEFQCIICDKIFTSKAVATRHYNTHSDIKQHKCHVCKKRFRRKEHLKTHTTYHCKKL